MRKRSNDPLDAQVSERTCILSRRSAPNEELIPDSDSTFVFATLGWRMTVARDAAGRATGFTVTRDGGPPVQATRAP